MTPILNQHTVEFVSRSPDQTQRLGARLGALLHAGAVICLEGALGSGKTCLAQGIGRGWGVEQRLISPSFVLVREYARPEDSVRLYHIDLYRIASVEEVWDLGADEFLGNEQTVCVIEWAERAQPLIPHEHLRITLDFADHASQNRRILYFTAQGEQHEAMLVEFRRSAFGV
jgi:tRNA threonylcarbamoyladenosine biosynthesis protein TsaE